MVGEGNTSNGKRNEYIAPAVLRWSEAAQNGCAVRSDIDCTDGSSSGGFQTYKRQKRRKRSLEAEPTKDGCSVQAGTQLADETSKQSIGVGLLNHFSKQAVNVNGLDDRQQRNWRDIVLDQICQSLSDCEGGLQDCVRVALQSCPEVDYKSTVEKPMQFHEDVRCHPQSGSTSRSHVGDASNRYLSGSDIHTSSEVCRRSFFRLIMSEKFGSLCKLMLENFQGIRVDNFFKEFNLIHLRMREGTYERSPMLFCFDIQQVWKKLQKIGTEMESLGKSLQVMTTTAYFELMKAKIKRAPEDGKNEFITRESDSQSKLQQLLACGFFQVCSCRHCGDKADGTDCLVCDSCEKVYHISCVEPAVKEIPPKSWYCVDCIVSRLPHKNCVVCEKLNAQRTLINGVGDESTSTNEETDMELEESSNCEIEVGIEEQRDLKPLQPCKICGSDMEFGEHLLKCSHLFCPSKYYHKSCLTRTELRKYGPKWYCPSCLCRACLTDCNDDKIILCDGCDHAYHIYCMNPPSSSIPSGRWFCRKCDADITRIFKAKKVYEDLERKRKQKSERVLDKDEGPMDILLNAAQTQEDLERERERKGEQVIDKDEGPMERKRKGERVIDKDEGPMDMLLNAAQTLNLQEELAAINKIR